MPTILDAAGVEIPDTCTWQKPAAYHAAVRQIVYGTAYTVNTPGVTNTNMGTHYLTDGNHKYIWYSQTGQEHLFNLQDDPHETRDLARSSDAESLLPPWRNRLIEFLRDRS